MKIITTIKEMHEYSADCRRNGKSIGFVPTMGALHEGHLSLIRASDAENDITIVSIFVNPTQFGANEDLDKYPRTLDRDTELSAESGADVIFAPTAAEMYGANYATYINVESLTQGLCGKSRPTHFRGVTTVVAKLFNIVSPRRAYFGQKDAQQLAVISKMVADLNMSVEIIPCPIVRELDGLAMSSRNMYLTPAEREQATILYEALTAAQILITAGETDAAIIKEKIASILNTKNLATIDYVEIVDFATFHEIETIKPPTLIALAVKFGNTRLIDNLIINEVQKP
ncbi:MAG: pantoate--beta-alanine ligase [Oscillospiraceae bacterium]|nr:pantoate--beta-alanine ligase [Oscillospiraceae bacterium]